MEDQTARKRRVKRSRITALVAGISVWVIIGVIAAVLPVGNIGTASPAPVAATFTTTAVTPVAQPTQTPTHELKWTVTHTFKGNGIQKTPLFDVPDDFRLTWKCDPSSDYFGSYNVIVEVDAPDGSYLDSAVNTICKAGNTSGSTELHGDAGRVYLDISSEDVWTIQIQELL